MNFVKLIKNCTPLASRWICAGARLQSTSGSLIHVDVNDKTGTALVSLNRKPVNALSLEVFKEFCGVMDDLEKSNIRGMILKSSLENVFSSGLDINELYPNPTEDRFHAYWLFFQEAWLKLYGSSFPTACFINGHAPAGGCVLALSCEYRVMLPYYKIGLNESPVGIVAPFWVMSTAKAVVGSKKAERILLTGQLMESQEALDFGLVDKLVNNEEEALLRCEEFFETFDKVGRLARSLTKLHFRKNELETLSKNRSSDAKQFLNHILRPETQKIIGNYFKLLKKTHKE